MILLQKGVEDGRATLIALFMSGSHAPDDAFTLASLLVEISGEPRQGGTGYVAPRSGKVHFDGTPKLTFYSICPNLIVHKYLEL